MESGKNDQVDTAINYLQRVLETGSNLEHKLNPMQLKQKQLTSRFGGAQGLRLSRLAFAVIIKFQDLLEDFRNMVDSVAIEIEMSDDGPDKEKAVIEQLKKMNQAEKIIK